MRYNIGGNYYADTVIFDWKSYISDYKLLTTTRKIEIDLVSKCPMYPHNK